MFPVVVVCKLMYKTVNKCIKQNTDIQTQVRRIESGMASLFWPVPASYLIGLCTE